MKTLIESAIANKSTLLVEQIAKKENVAPKLILEKIAQGKLVIPANNTRTLSKPCGIGELMSVKINANLGTSPDESDTKNELKKLKTAIQFGADTVMDLSIAGNIRRNQKTLINKCSVPLGTVPLYEIALSAKKLRGSIYNLTKNDFLDVLVEQAKTGIDFFTIHSGITKKTMKILEQYPRFMGIVSRGGAITADWIKKTKKENPFYEYFDDVIKICKKYDITLSLGDGLRPGTIMDATDKPQIAELKLLGKLARQAQAQGVQVMIEGPGHIPIDQISRNVALQKKHCNGAPFYVLGPLVTDIGMGYDHITAAIGSGIAAASGADFICFVTPAEHIKLPNIDDIKQGVIASKIAAHAGDLARGNKQAWEKDRLMSLSRKKRDWETQIKMAIDPQLIKDLRAASNPKVSDACTMCGEFCSMKLMDE